MKDKGWQDEKWCSENCKSPFQPLSFILQPSLMPLILFFARRIFGGMVAKAVTGFLVKRFNVSGGLASLIFVIIAELLARSSEKAVPDAKIEAAAKKAK